MIQCLTDIEQRSIKQDNSKLVALDAITFRSVSSGYMVPGKRKTYTRVCIVIQRSYEGVMENKIVINMSPVNNRPFVVCYKITLSYHRLNDLHTC